MRKKSEKNNFAYINVIYLEKIGSYDIDTIGLNRVSLKSITKASMNSFLLHYFKSKLAYSCIDLLLYTQCITFMKTGLLSMNILSKHNSL
jgi:hypothetical protein